MANEAGVASKDFFLLRPADGWEGCLAKYGHASTISQTLSREFLAEADLAGLLLPSLE